MNQFWFKSEWKSEHPAIWGEWNRLGDCVFTTLKYGPSGGFFANEHFDRLRAQANEFFQLGPTESKKFNGQLDRLKIDLKSLRADCALRVNAILFEGEVELFAQTRSLNNLNEGPVRCKTEVAYHYQSSTRFKLPEYGLSQFFKRKNKDLGFNEVLFCDKDNYILECSVGNIIFLTENEVIAPKLKNKVFQGITLAQLEKCCREHQINFIAKEVQLTDLNTFQSAYMINSVVGLKKIDLIDNVRYTESEFSDKLSKCFSKYCEYYRVNYE